MVERRCPGQCPEGLWVQNIFPAIFETAIVLWTAFLVVSPPPALLINMKRARDDLEEDEVRAAAMELGGTLTRGIDVKLRVRPN